MASVLRENSKFRRFREASLKGWMKLGVKRDTLSWYHTIEEPENGFDPVEPCMFPSSNWNDKMWPKQTQYPAKAKLSLRKAKDTFLLEADDVRDLCYVEYRPRGSEHTAHLYLATQLERRAWEKYGGPRGFKEAQAAKKKNAIKQPNERRSTNGGGQLPAAAFVATAYQPCARASDFYGVINHDYPGSVYSVSREPSPDPFEDFELQAILAISLGQSHHSAYHVDGAPLQTLGPSNKTQQNITPFSSTASPSTPIQQTKNQTPRRKRRPGEYSDWPELVFSSAPLRSPSPSTSLSARNNSHSNVRGSSSNLPASPIASSSLTPSGRKRKQYVSDSNDDDVTVGSSSPRKSISVSPQKLTVLSQCMSHFPMDPQSLSGRKKVASWSEGIIDLTLESDDDTSGPASAIKFQSSSPSKGKERMKYSFNNDDENVAVFSSSPRMAMSASPSRKRRKLSLGASKNEIIELTDSD